MFESEMIGAIKIKDGLFIGDELASTVSTLEVCLTVMCLGSGICRCQQSHSYHQLRWQANLKSLGAYWGCLFDFLLVGLRQLGKNSNLFETV